ncbi:MAG: hypothetical protein ACTMUB_02880 [cyanobacterium endosymbiont of Rhopalodia musculus]|uniref:hypothetical protein n=1 Tax=cyanobacterium endosymbiont of Epithemia clementina EcSB TaxID=3034674 RepID=UPI0024806A65|nr:hypothetical protein [cyanobacterium endosymbiont of Epithemia clementina EcSB]WGT67162.1 hypothetical protein P3F56_08045 [cyanobacterium endosymbiont of Epithemia clementina EcSB]
MAKSLKFASTLPLYEPMYEPKWVVSILSGQNIGLNLVHTLQHRQFQGQIALTIYTQ